MNNAVEKLKALIQDNEYNHNEYNQTSKQKIIILMQKIAKSIAEEKDIENINYYSCMAGNICPELSCDFLDLNGNLKYTVWIVKKKDLFIEVKKFNRLKLIKKERVV
ncbi:MAG: hypothetical protein ACOCUI_05160 [bacterium]